jgi:hypothetical protein
MLFVWFAGAILSALSLSPFPVFHNSIILDFVENETDIGGMASKFPTFPPHLGNLHSRSWPEEVDQTLIAVYLLYIVSVNLPIHFSRLTAYKIQK